MFLTKISYDSEKDQKNNLIMLYVMKKIIFDSAWFG